MASLSEVLLGPRVLLLLLVSLSGDGKDPELSRRSRDVEELHVDHGSGVKHHGLVVLEVPGLGR